MSKIEENVNEAVETATEEIAEKVIERPYTLRKLKNGDLWPILNVLRKTLPEDVVRTLLKFITSDMDVEEAGYLAVINVGAEVVKNAGRAQVEIDELCADFAGVSIEELNEMEFGTTPMIILDIFSDAKNVPFFKVLSKFFS